MWLNRFQIKPEPVLLEGSNQKVEYSHDLFTEETLKWIKENKKALLSLYSANHPPRKQRRNTHVWRRCGSAGIWNLRKAGQAG